MIDVMFYEAFKEEEGAIKKFLPDNVNARFTGQTIQENGNDDQDTHGSLRPFFRIADDSAPAPRSCSL